MRAGVIAVSKSGAELAKKLSGAFEEIDLYVPERLFKEIENEAGSQKNSEFIVKPLEEGFYPGVAGLFHAYPALIFISATAVAVRAIAPCLAGKARDPAVVVVDETGRYAISLLSGHLGGANALTEKVAGKLGSEAVITTATDGKGITAFDDLARRWGWQIENLPALKKISAAMLEGREIVLYCRGGQEFLTEETLSGNIYLTGNREELSRAKHGLVLIDNRLEAGPLPKGVPFITLRPRNVAAGIGCRKNVPAGAIIRAVRQAFKAAGLSAGSLSCLASGEFKAGEEGLVEAARYFEVPLKIFKREEINAVLAEKSSPVSENSAFVKETVGVGAVAEPCALLAGERNNLVLPVQRGEGITVSLAEGKPVFAGQL